MTNTFKLGLFTLLGLFSIGVLLVWKSDLMVQRSSYKLIGTFDHIGGLKKGSAVRYRGYKIGYVELIIPGPESVDILFYVDNNYLIPVGSTAKIMFDGLVGQNYLGIAPNTQEKKLFLKEGDHIEGVLSSDLAHFIDLGSKGLSQIDQILASVQGMIGTKKAQKHFAHILENLDHIMTELSGVLGAMGDDNSSIIGDSFTHLHHISQLLDKELTYLFEEKKMGEDLSVLIKSLSDLSASLVKTSDGISSFFDADNKSNFDESLTNLNQLILNLNHFFAPQTPKKTSGVFDFLKRLNRLNFYSQSDLVFNEEKTTSFYDLSFFGQVDRSYLKVSIGDRFGSLDLTGLQHGFYLNSYLGTRVGLFNYKPGFGFDLHPFQKLQFNLDVYNPNLVDVDLFAKYKIYDPFSFKLGVVNDLVSRKWNNLLFGLNFGL